MSQACPTTSVARSLIERLTRDKPDTYIEYTKWLHAHRHELREFFLGTGHSPEIVQFICMDRFFDERGCKFETVKNTQPAVAASPTHAERLRYRSTARPAGFLARLFGRKAT